MNVDITITACRRSDILSETLHSFWQNLLYESGCEFRAIINIDPIGTDTSNDGVIKVCHKYFSEVLCRTPIVPDFSSAFIWTWSQIRTEFFIHLEDDWELIRPIDFWSMANILKHDPKLALLRLSQFKSDDGDLKCWNLFYPFNGLYYECPKELKGTAGFCGHPSLIKKEFANRTVPHLQIGHNPEKQFHWQKDLLKEIGKWEYGVYQQPNQPNSVRDIGRKWMIENGFMKAGSKAFFLYWQENDKQEV